MVECPVLCAIRHTSERGNNMARGYDETKPVRIWVGNYGHYNNGYLVGDWFSLPMDRDELWAGINEACKCDRFHDEVGCFDYECDVRDCGLNEYMSIDSVNALAAAIENAYDHELRAAEAYMSQQSSTSVLQAANIIFDADSISFNGYLYNSDFMSKEEKYGRTMLEECDIELFNMLEERGYTDYFDYEAYGRDTDDTLFEDGYLWANSDEPDDNAYEALELLEHFGYYIPKDDDYEVA